jgi:hypothetical protein
MKIYLAGDAYQELREREWSKLVSHRLLSYFVILSKADLWLTIYR